MNTRLERPSSPLRPPPEFDPRLRPRRPPLRPGERLRRRVDLVVVAPRRKGGQLGEVFGEPGGLFRQTDEAVLDRRVSACRRMTLSPCGEMRVAREQPAAISSWISCVPEALSSISHG